jgi:hypothetical protein
LIFSIAMGADNSFYVKFIATYAPTFFGYIISVLVLYFRYSTTISFGIIFKKDRCIKCAYPSPLSFFLSVESIKIICSTTFYAFKTYTVKKIQEIFESKFNRIVT